MTATSPTTAVPDSLDTAAIRADLVARLERMSRRIDAIEADLHKEQNADWDEAATERENDEVLTRLDEHGLDEVRLIRAAIARIDAGTYAECASCGGDIAPRRLQALPWAATCIGCAS